MHMPIHQWGSMALQQKSVKGWQKTRVPPFQSLACLICSGLKLLGTSRRRTL